jgi:hypothetical protein
MRWALVVGGVVENIIIWDGDTSRWQPPAGAQVVAVAAGQACSIGWTYDGSTFTEPEEP